MAYTITRHRCLYVNERKKAFFIIPSQESH
nr:MAG TPA: hypothetical protein [Caudoviricetes sp.]